jgi:hypothetical protein
MDTDGVADQTPRGFCIAGLRRCRLGIVVRNKIHGDMLARIMIGQDGNSREQNNITSCSVADHRPHCDNI